MTHPHPVRALVALLALAVAASGALAACRDEAAAATELTLVAAEDGAYRYDLPAEVPAGLTRVSLDNRGAEPHHAQLFRLAEGRTVDDLAEALVAGGPPAALEVGTFEGGIGLVAPGERSRADAVVDLEPGSYALLCLVPGPGGAAHVADGMLQPFEVAGGGDDGDRPDVDAAVELVDYAVEMPGSVSGDALLEVANRAAEPHELIMVRLDGDATADDLRGALHEGGTLPGTAVGGVQALLPGAVQHLQLDLEPGRYAVSCAVPSPDGTPHHDTGMIREVTVT
ncbi:MAG TPA: hypothetical protein VFZ77_10955 [Acidimicrobiales bacterium]